MRIFQPSLAAALLAFGAASLCSADSIVYDVNQIVGAGSVIGNIVTDGTLGLLEVSNILDWSLLLNDGVTTALLNGANSFAEMGGSPGFDLSATETQLLFDFSNNSINIEFFDDSNDYMCFEGGPDCGTSAGEVLGIGTDNPQFTSLSGTQVIATAASTPEPSTLALLGAGIALLGLRKTKTRTESSK